MRLYAPEVDGKKCQVLFRGPAGDGAPWKRVLRQANSEAEARTIFAQAETALDTVKEVPAGRRRRRDGPGQHRPLVAPDGHRPGFLQDRPAALHHRRRAAPLHLRAAPRLPARHRSSEEKRMALAEAALDARLAPVREGTAVTDLLPSPRAAGGPPNRSVLQICNAMLTAGAARTCCVAVLFGRAQRLRLSPPRVGARSSSDGRRRRSRRSRGR